MALYDPENFPSLSEKIADEVKPSRKREAREILEEVGRYLANFPSTPVRLFRSYVVGEPVPRFKMRDFYRDRVGSVLSPRPSIRNECGGSACVVGHAYVMMPEEFEHCTSWHGVMDMMVPRDISFLRRREVDETLFGGGWSDDPMDAADRIAYFLRTGETLWDSFSKPHMRRYQSLAKGSARVAGWCR